MQCCVFTYNPMCMHFGAILCATVAKVNEQCRTGLRCGFLIFRDQCLASGLSAFSDVLDDPAAYYIVDTNEPVLVAATTILMSSPSHDITYVSAFQSPIPNLCQGRPIWVNCYSWVASANAGQWEFDAALQKMSMLWECAHSLLKAHHSESAAWAGHGQSQEINGGQ